MAQTWNLCSPVSQKVTLSMASSPAATNQDLNSKSSACPIQNASTAWLNWSMPIMERSFSSVQMWTYTSSSTLSLWKSEKTAKEKSLLRKTRATICARTKLRALMENVCVGLVTPAITVRKLSNQATKAATHRGHTSTCFCCCAQVVS